MTSQGRKVEEFNQKVFLFQVITMAEVEQYQFETHLVEEKEVATSTVNQAINVLKFYYGTVLSNTGGNTDPKDGYSTGQKKADTFHQGQQTIYKAWER